MTIQNGGTIQAASIGIADAGNIMLNSTNLMLYDGVIVTYSEETSGGNITIHTDNLLHINGSMFNAESKSAQIQDSAGDIIIDQADFAVLNNSLIITKGFISSGGNIDIITEQFLQSTDSILDVSSQFGLDGEITIEAPDTDLTNSQVILPKTFFDASDFFLKSCTGRDFHKNLKLQGRKWPDEVLEEIANSSQF